MSDFSKISVQLRSRTTRPVLALLMGTVLVGCAAPGFGPGVSRYEPTYLRMTGERDFALALRRHYLELSTNAFDRGDTQRSDFYSLRALMAAEGKLAQPVQQSGGGEIAAAGARLTQLLSTGARTGSPDLAARAQAAYDCWQIESGSDGNPQIAHACRFNTMNALAELEGASTGAQLQAAGAGLQGQTQSYVVQPGVGVQGQTFQGPGGYTIQIITETHAPIPAHTKTIVPQAVPQFVETHSVVQSAPQFVETRSVVQSAPQFVETLPVAQPAPPIQFVEQASNTHQEFVAPPQVISAPPIAFAEPSFEPVPAAPIFQEVQAAPIARSVPTIDLGPIDAQRPVLAAPIETVPVFDTAPIQTLPQIEIASLPISDTSSAAQALVDATANMSGDFSVFFGFDSDEVTIEAEDVLFDAVEQIRLSGARRVSLAGFTDSMGNARYNQLLAMRRAQSVRKFLQKSLGNSVTFEILPVGELQAVRSGGDGIKEALNRKVQITLQ